ncbi:MAG: dipeptide ABC transporter ATP-binding protein [Alphaproteobacteria bacterium]|nr:dipeptide ABC transporter ATP-binding protein [Alphaproteobacteria bacterium]
MTDAQPILEVEDLRTYFFSDSGVVRAVDGVSFHVNAGETLGIVGESGSGKSITAKSVIRLIDEPGRIVSGRIAFRGRNVVTMDAARLRKFRGGEVAMVFQDPMTSLNPVLRIARQLVETMVAHGRFTKKAALRRAVDLLGRMGINAPKRAVDSYPHEFSGGMRQRVMLAMGFSNEPTLLIADEPTTALDVTIQAQILDLLRELNADFGTAIILISHDLGVIANICSRIVVMYAGEVVEEGPAESLLADPRHPYTWALLNAVPRLDRHTPGEKKLITIEGTPPDPADWPAGCRFRARCPFAIEACAEHPALTAIAPGRAARCWVTQRGGALPKVGGGATAAPAQPAAAARAGVSYAAATAASATRGEVLLDVRDVKKHFPLPKTTFFGERRVLHAVDGVDLAVFKGETVGLVGESGCGKSTLGRLIVRLHEPTAGQIAYGGVDITHADPATIRPLRRRLQMIFQDPYASLNPRMTVDEILGWPLKLHGMTQDGAETSARVRELLDVVGLSAQAAGRFPHEFSGGQRQRISIARALAVSPEFIVADEPISALDVNIQAQIINLLIDLQRRFALTYLFIAHDLAVVRHVSDRIVVLYLGKVMEVAPAAALFDMPLHPYTKSLISAAPIPDAAIERRRERVRLTGEPPSAIDVPSGCRFRTRCPIAAERCAAEMPPLAENRPGHWVACHFPGKL